MTREEAITTLRNVAWLGADKKVGQVEEALQMAIEALEHPPIIAAMVTCPTCGRGFTVDFSEKGAEA